MAKLSRRLPLVLLGLSAFVAPAAASSPDAWNQFHAKVEEKCLEAADGLFRRPQIAIDKLGSERFGLAIVFGKSKGADGRAAVICVYDKRTGAVELGSEMGPDQIRVRKARPLDENGDPVQRKNRQQNQTDKTQDDADMDEL